MRLGQLSYALEELSRTACSLGKAEAHGNDHDLVGVLHDLHLEPGQSPSLTVLNYSAEGAIVGGRADVAHALSHDMIQQMMAEGGMGHGIESQEDAEENEGDETGDGDGPTLSRTLEMLRHLGRAEEFAAGTGDGDVLAYPP